ncbi:MAG: hypothetical protein R2880_05505 [Deinococcales bacterium]
MHLVALMSSDPSLLALLSHFHDPVSRLYFHPLDAEARLDEVCSALKTLDFVGLLALDIEFQEKFFRHVQRSNLDAQEARAIDTVMVTAHGLIGEYNLGRALLSALQDELWDARDARVMVVGSNLQARAICRELSSAGISHLSIISANLPQAESIASRLALSTEVAVRSLYDAGIPSLLSKADLLIHLGGEELRLKDDFLGPHLSVVDLSSDSLSPLRKKALRLGALTLSLRDVQARQISLGLNHMLGSQLSATQFLELLHSLDSGQDPRHSH